MNFNQSFLSSISEYQFTDSLYRAVCFETFRLENRSRIMIPKWILWKNYYYKLEIPVKKNLPYKEILSDHRSVFIKPEGSLSSQNELTKPNSFSIFIANCCISGKYKDGDFTTQFQMNHVIPCHMLTQTTLSQRRSFLTGISSL